MAYEPSIKEQIARSSKALNEALAGLKAGTNSGLEAFAQDFLRSMYDKLSHPGSGVQYPGNPNVSSAPGEPPAPQSEEYRDSWDYKLGEDSEGAYVDIGSPKEYGPALEYGTSKIAPRPHLRPLVDEKKGELAIQLAQSAKKGEEANGGEDGLKKIQELIETVLGGE